MREIEGSAHDWLDQRAQAHMQDDAAADYGGGFPPIDDPHPEPPSDWWVALTFDPKGDTVPNGGKQWSANDLARSGRAWAQIAADLLAAKTGDPNVNNRACALVFADPDDLATPADLLGPIAATSLIAAANLAILVAHGAGA